MIITDLTEISNDRLYEAFKNAFADYERQWTADEFFRMLRRRGYRPEISFGAFENAMLVSFTLNGLGTYNGSLSAYDTGSGTIPEFRSKGFAKEIFQFSIPILRSKGVKQYILEVLQNNAKAISLYKKTGFSITREYNYFMKQISEIKIPIVTNDVHLQPITFERINEMTSMHDFSPSWQNSFESLVRCKDDFIIIGAFENDMLIGYGIVEPLSGDIPQIAVQKQMRRKRIATHIFSELISHIKVPSIKIINTDKTDIATTIFLESMNIQITGEQFEMQLEI
jgi:ribosomal protein S18 acetylase RimI-like enzyme